ncbi:MAG: hypothetical protein A2511_02085 [Deltaproteobacteria bacterium RIFOXYD12_FULL_50_9]|nr:MAG: hypothetical protein A2511_02085 [Deltaproteobacteria bacterium RIFOXYD12_FULL_50_9]
MNKDRGVVVLLCSILWLGMGLPLAAFGAANYEPSITCENCHPKIYVQHAQSMHAKSVENPVFLAQYFKEMLPRAAKDPAFVEEAEGCFACHAPVAYLRGKRQLSPSDELPSPIMEVGCDFCHTISGFRGPELGNANYINTPGPSKLGPFQTKSDWHRKFAKLQTRSEVCAVCHNVVNKQGLGVAVTYDEWKNSQYAKDNIQCQDCHMNINGFLTGGKARFEKGKAASMAFVEVQERGKIFTHRFPGAHSASVVHGAVGLKIEPGVRTAEGLVVDILVDNSRTGHKMPSGSTQLRMMWLELKAGSGGQMVTIPAVSVKEQDGGYDVTSGGAVDSELLGEGIPKASRLYRAIFTDADGKPTMSAYDAVKIAFDNRLEASEVRKESYLIPVPAGTTEIALSASLYYMAYPPAFAKRLDLPVPNPVIIAAANKRVEVK